MPSKKVYIVLMVTLVIFFVLMFVRFGIRNIQEENFESTIIVGDNTTWIFRNRKWLFLRKSVLLQQMDGEGFHVFDNNQELGVYNLVYNQQWLVKDKNDKDVSIDGDLLAYRANYIMKVQGFKESKVDDYSYVRKVLEDQNLGVNSQFTSIYKVSLDFDSDSSKEDFYIISNAFPLDFEPENTFSIAFMVKEDTIYYMYTDISNFNSLNACKPYYRSFIDTNYDDIYEVILSCGRYSATDRVDMLFQFQEDEFKLLISNQ